MIKEINNIIKEKDETINKLLEIIQRYENNYKKD